MNRTDVRAYVRAQISAGQAVTGAGLARRFHISDSLGRRYLREVKAEGNGTGTASTAPAPSVPELAALLNGDLRPEPGPEAPLPEVPEHQLRSVSTAEGTAEPEQELVTTPEPERDTSRRWTLLAVLLIAVVAAIVSFAHQQHLAWEAGEAWRSYLIPLSVDGLIAAASFTLIQRRRKGRAAKLATWTLILAIAASVAANIAAADPTTIARIIAAWPPVALVLSIELLTQHTRKDT